MCRSLRILSLLALMMTLAATAAMAAKVEICHFPPGNQDNWHTISVSTNALTAHLNHGDLEGSCYENCETICSDGDACTQDVEPDGAVCICKAEPTPVDCDDGNPCTADSCSSEAGACVYDTAVLDGTACDDGDAGTTGDVCTGGVCAGAPPVDPCRPNPCNGGTCTDLGGGNFECDCPDGTTGEFCEIPTANSCRPNPCNAGTCTELEGGESNALALRSGPARFVRPRPTPEKPSPTAPPATTANQHRWVPAEQSQRRATLLEALLPADDGQNDRGVEKAIERGDPERHWRLASAFCRWV